MFALRAEHFVTEQSPRNGDCQKPFFEWLEFYEEFLGRPFIRRATEILADELGSEPGEILYSATTDFNADVFNRIMEKASNE